MLCKLKKTGFRVLPVFDGISRHPLKAAKAGASRNRSSTNAAEKLGDLIKRPFPENKEEQNEILSSILKCRKGSARVNASVTAEVIRVLRDNDIPFVVAPFEADWQLAYLFNIGQIHCIASRDTDFWALVDSPCLLMNLLANSLKALIAVNEFSDCCSSSTESIQK